MPQQKRVAAEVAEKKITNAADDEIEEVSIITNPESVSADEKPLIAGVAAKDKLNSAKESAKPNKSSEMKEIEEMADKEEKAKTSKFDVTKKVKNLQSHVCSIDYSQFVHRNWKG
jgi:hypothetical protein